MRVPGALFDVVNIVGNGVVVVDVADAGESQFLMAGRALHGIAVDDPRQPLVETGTAFGAPDLDPVILDFMLVRIGHGIVSGGILHPRN